jgi:hypothetical protein
MKCLFEVATSSSRLFISRPDCHRLLQRRPGSMMDWQTDWLAGQWESIQHNVPAVKQFFLSWPWWPLQVPSHVSSSRGPTATCSSSGGRGRWWTDRLTDWRASGKTSNIMCKRCYEVSLQFDFKGAVVCICMYTYVLCMYPMHICMYLYVSVCICMYLFCVNDLETITRRSCTYIHIHANTYIHMKQKESWTTCNPDTCFLSIMKA